MESRHESRTESWHESRTEPRREHLAPIPWGRGARSRPRAESPAAPPST
jgi:hypothetical protein